MQDLCWDLANSSRESVSDSLDLGAPAVSFFSAEPPAPSAETVEFAPGGQILWQKSTCYFLDVERRVLLRNEVGFPSPSPLPSRSLAPSLSDFQSLDGPGCKVMARQISGFEVSLLPTGNYQITLSSLETLGAGEEETSVELVTEIGARN
jgi:hypothetical protein